MLDTSGLRLQDCLTPSGTVCQSGEGTNLCISSLARTRLIAPTAHGEGPPWQNPLAPAFPIAHHSLPHD